MNIETDWTALRVIISLTHLKRLASRNWRLVIIEYIVSANFFLYHLLKS